MQKPAFPQHLTESAKRKAGSQQQVVRPQCPGGPNCNLEVKWISRVEYRGKIIETKWCEYHGRQMMKDGIPNPKEWSAS